LYLIIVYAFILVARRIEARLQAHLGAVPAMRQAGGGAR